MRIAVIGGGVSGLVAAWLLGRRHDVSLFEARSRLGGHAHTVAVREGRTRLPLDLGFMVYNEVTYPVLTRIFDRLSVPTRPTDMSFSVRCEACDVEYGGTGPAGLLAQPRNLLRPEFLTMLRDVARLASEGRRALENGAADRSLGAFLGASGLGDAFRRHYLLPLAAALWSAGTDRAGDIPARTVLRFLDNHGLLDLRERLRWRTVAGGSHRYVRAMARSLEGRIVTGAPVEDLERGPDAVRVHVAGSGSEAFDAAVVATHADQALRLLADPTPDERDLLGAWSYADNAVWLHTDPSLLPERETARASWNYRLEDCRREEPSASVSYHLNRLQRVPSETDYVVTLNPARPPAEERVLLRTRYAHPVFSSESVATQPELSSLQGVHRTWFCGAYFGYGFHEDGARAALRVAEDLGAGLPVAEAA